MEHEATVTQDGGVLREALLSTDDLISKIGSLTVEIMHKDRAIAETGKRATSSVGGLANELSAAKAEVVKLQGEVSKALSTSKQMEGYKTSHDALSVKHNELCVKYDELRADLKTSQQEVGRLSAQLDALSGVTKEAENLRAEVERLLKKASKAKKRA